MRYAEDFAVGQVHELGSWHVSEREIIEFGEQWDPLPLHVDPAAAAGTRFGTVIASGIHSMAIMQRLTIDGLLADTAVVAGLGADGIRLPAPIRAGTTVDGAIEVLDVRVDPERDGVVTWRSTLRDEHETLVLEQRIRSLIERRP